MLTLEENLIYLNNSWGGRGKEPFVPGILAKERKEGGTG